MSATRGIDLSPDEILHGSRLRSRRCGVGPTAQIRRPRRLRACRRVIWVASGSPYALTEIRTSDLGATGVTYPTEPYPVAVAAANGVIASTSSIGSIWVFAAGSPSTHVTLDPTQSLVDCDSQGLGWSPYGNAFYAVRSNLITAGPSTRSTRSILTGRRQEPSPYQAERGAWRLPRRPSSTLRLSRPSASHLARSWPGDRGR